MEGRAQGGKPRRGEAMAAQKGKAAAWGEARPRGGEAMTAQGGA